MDRLRIAVVGQGVAGLSSALALLERHPTSKVTVFGDRPFEKTCSYGPAGLFRVDTEKNRDLARPAFERFAFLHRTRSGEETGVKLVSGIIESDDLQLLELQERCYGDIVYGFRWMDKQEQLALCANPAKYAIAFTTFASEGRRYVPFLMRELEKIGRVSFETKQFENLDQLSSSFDVAVNCAGLDGGRLAGDDSEGVIPNRGVAIAVHAPWHKGFFYRGVDSFTIPMVDSVVLGTTRIDGRYDREVTEEDKKDVLGRYYAIHPAIKSAPIIEEWVGLRPLRKAGVRLEAQLRKADSAGNRQFLAVHNYGHGGNGFTLGWGCALKVVDLIEDFASNNIPLVKI